MAQSSSTLWINTWEVRFCVNANKGDSIHISLFNANNNNNYITQLTNMGLKYVYCGYRAGMPNIRTVSFTFNSLSSGTMLNNFGDNKSVTMTFISIFNDSLSNELEYTELRERNLGQNLDKTIEQTVMMRTKQCV